MRDRCDDRRGLCVGRLEILTWKRVFCAHIKKTPIKIEVLIRVKCEFRFRGRRLLLKSVDLAHDNRRSRRAEARCNMLDPLRGGFTEPATALAAIDGVKRAGMRIHAGGDDANISAQG